MLSLRDRTSAEGIGVHCSLPARVYEHDANHGLRIEKAREAVAKTSGSIIELCCGTGDICGPFSSRYVQGYDCNPKAIEEAQRRYPEGDFYVADLNDIVPQNCGTLILCETLEHLADPARVVCDWLCLADYSVISHPLNEVEMFQAGIDLSAGEHQWSFNEEDFEKWFAMGGHELVQKQKFKMGSYEVILGVGRRLNA